jgi:hypothetical protein
VKIFDDYSKIEDTYIFDLIYENENLPLFPEVLPSCGKNYFVKADQLAFEGAKKICPPELFNKIGLFFQKVLLPPLSGWDEMTSHLLNNETRASIISLFEKTLRLSEGCGKAKIIFSLSNMVNGNQFREFPFVSSFSSKYSSEFYSFLITNKARSEKPKPKKVIPFTEEDLKEKKTLIPTTNSITVSEGSWKEVMTAGKEKTEGNK